MGFLLFLLFSFFLEYMMHSNICNFTAVQLNQVFMFHVSFKSIVFGLGALHQHKREAVLVLCNATVHVPQLMMFSEKHLL